jgi:hypothetical protein
MTYRQIQWIKGNFLPPKVQIYTDNKSYVLDISKDIPINITQAYAESIGKEGY